MTVADTRRRLIDTIEGTDPDPTVPELADAIITAGWTPDHAPLPPLHRSHGRLITACVEWRIAHETHGHHWRLRADELLLAAVLDYEREEHAVETLVTGNGPVPS